MQRLITTALVFTLATTTFAQLDDVSKKAQQLEGKLSKVIDSSPDAAPIMIELIDLYHSNGRVFGLIRVGNRFMAAQPTHRNHRDVMLKLLDGLVITSRHKDIIGTARQFIGRYNKDKATNSVMITLAETLERTNKKREAAPIYEQLWHRNAPNARQHGARALRMYVSMNNKPAYQAATKLAESMLDKLPVDKTTADLAAAAYHYPRNYSDWAASNKLAIKAIQKKYPMTDEQKSRLYYYVAENYHNQDQRKNAADAYGKGRKFKDNEEIHRKHIEALYRAEAKSSQLEPIVNDYAKKYPNTDNSYSLQALVGHTYKREKNDAKAMQIFRDLMPNRTFHEIASTYVSMNKDHKDSERVLLNALKTNKKDAGYLRYVLAFSVYRDRLKDEAKAFATARQMVLETPTNNHYTRNAMHWLLNSQKDDAAFTRTLREVVAAQFKYPHMSYYRSAIYDWQRDAQRRREMKQRWSIIKNETAKLKNNQELADWYLIGRNSYDKKSMDAYARIARKNLTDDQAWQVLSNWSYNLYRSSRTRKQAPPVYAQRAKRFPKSYEAAKGYLWISTDYGTPAQMKDAAQRFMKFAPTPGKRDADAWWRLVNTADKNNDAGLLKQAMAWIKKDQQANGMAPENAPAIGRVLEKYKMKNEAMAFWKAAGEVSTTHYHSREAAGEYVKRLEGNAKANFIKQLIKTSPNYYGDYSGWLANIHMENGDLNEAESIMREAIARRDAAIIGGWGMGEYPAYQWVDHYRRSETKATDADRKRVFELVRDLRVGRASARAQLALLAMTEPGDYPGGEIARLRAYEAATRMGGTSSYDYDSLISFAQGTMARKDYAASATLLTGILNNIRGIDSRRKQAAREMVGRSYSRMGGVGMAIDESSPIAPLLQAVLYLRLGDNKLAFDTYATNRALFDKHRNEVPIDLILFVADSHIAAGGEANHDRAEDILRSWLVKFSESKDVEDATKARVQVMLGKNYFKAQRYEVARTEFQSVLNQYPKTDEAIDAEFGIGESFMAQKIYDKAEAVFEKLANSRSRNVMVRAEFLRGMLANRRGDRETARDIFKSVLERVPGIDLANMTLFNLSEVYREEQRYIEQLELLQTVGRLGRNSKRWHTPGMDLSIVVQDSDLGISRGHLKIPAILRTKPGGDEEHVFLYSGGAGKGLFRTSVTTQLGKVNKDDKILQLTGNDIITCDYPDGFKAEFRNVPLADAEIRVAAAAEFDVSSAKIEDEEEESFSQRLARQAREEEDADQRMSQGRPPNQIKPGNVIYLRVKDADRDLSDDQDKVIVKLVASSGDAVQVQLQETEAHNGVFEGTVNTGELPAGALASDNAIDQSPLKAIDQSKETFWQSEPDGATPKHVSVDMKDLRTVSRVKVYTPNPERQAPVRGELQGSHDGRFWYRLNSHPVPTPMEPLFGERGKMKVRVYSTRYITSINSWNHITDMIKRGGAIEEKEVDELEWGLDADNENSKRAHVAIWDGKFVQEKDAAVRFAVSGSVIAMVIDGQTALPMGKGGRTVDVYLTKGIHDLTIVAGAQNAVVGVEATRARENPNAEEVRMASFNKADFDLENARVTSEGDTKKEEAKPITVGEDGTWDIPFASHEVRYVRFVVHEYTGEAVAINHIEVGDDESPTKYIPTEADVLSLANNDQLEIAAGDEVTASYTDEYMPNPSMSDASNQILTKTLTATYYNGDIMPINYAFRREGSGQIQEIRKELMRIDPGERITIEVTDYDMDSTGAKDEIKVSVRVNEGAPIEMTAIETEEYSGIFRKEVDTSESQEEGKIMVKKGDQIVIAYTDRQNTFPGHSVPREEMVFVRVPTDGRARIIETRIEPPREGSNQPPRALFLAPNPDPRNEIAGMAFQVPLTIEVFDQDAAKDSHSSIVTKLVTTDGSEIEVECMVSDSFATDRPEDVDRWALIEGRFVGQVIMQLGSKNSPKIVPLTADMPRNLVGGPVVEDEEEEAGPDPQDNTRNRGRRSASAQLLEAHVLNLTGKDIVTATYNDELYPGQPSAPKPAGDTKAPEGEAAEPTEPVGPPAKAISARGRLIANGTLAITDREYDKPSEQLHVGEKIFLLVTDADLDVSDERDTVQIEIATQRGEKEMVALEETLDHSGVFTGSYDLKPDESPTPGNFSATKPEIESFFGDLITATYTDKAAATSSEDGTLVLTAEVPVVVGTDGLVAAFSKVFSDENLAVETQFHIAESYFELFKSHKKIGRSDDTRNDLEAGRRVLQEVIEDYPDPKYIPRISYLLGQFSQELGEWDSAIDSYRNITRNYPDHTLAPDAQFKLAQCYEESDRFDDALEAYVTLAATYPKSPLIANVMVRICDYFYKKENYVVSANVGEKFIERFEGHEWAPKMAYRIGQCFYKAEDFRKAAGAFDRFAKEFPDDELCSLSLFWAGESYRAAKRVPDAFRRYNRCRWEHPASEAAKYSRGRLALPEMLQQFEREANLDN